MEKRGGVALHRGPRIHHVFVLSKGFYGIVAEKVFLSLPAQLDRRGVVLAITHVHLTEEEAKRLSDSANAISEVQNTRTRTWEESN